MPPPDQASPPLDGPARHRTRYLAVLVNDRDVALLEVARGGWSDRGAIELAVGYSDKSLSRGFTRLTGLGLLAEREARSRREDRKVHEYRTSASGEGLLKVHVEMFAAAVALDAAGGGRRQLLSGAARDRRCLLVGRVVLVRPQTFTEVLQEARGLGRSWGMGEAANLDHSGLTRRLRLLERLGLVAREHSPQGAILYSRGPQMWLLARLAVEASLWRSIYTPEDIPPLAGELLGLVEMVIDRVRLDPELGPATVVLHVQPPAGTPGWLDAALDVEAGRIRVIRGGASRASTAYVPAPLRRWCEALRDGDFDAITIEGSRPIGDAVLKGVAAAMPPPSNAP